MSWFSECVYVCVCRYECVGLVHVYAYVCVGKIALV